VHNRAPGRDEFEARSHSSRRTVAENVGAEVDPAAPTERRPGQLNVQGCRGEVGLAGTWPDHDRSPSLTVSRQASPHDRESCTFRVVTRSAVPTLVNLNRLGADKPAGTKSFGGEKPPRCGLRCGASLESAVLGREIGEAEPRCRSTLIRPRDAVDAVRPRSARGRVAPGECSGEGSANACMSGAPMAVRTTRAPADATRARRPGWRRVRVKPTLAPPSVGSALTGLARAASKTFQRRGTRRA
jgi:hypothetical protein